MLLSPKQHRAKFAFVGINTVVFLDFTVVLSPKRAWICLSEDLEFTEFQTEATSKGIVLVNGRFESSKAFSDIFLIPAFSINFLLNVCFQLRQWSKANTLWWRGWGRERELLKLCGLCFLFLSLDHSVNQQQQLSRNNSEYVECQNRQVSMYIYNSKSRLCQDFTLKLSLVKCSRTWPLCDKTWN